MSEREKKEIVIGNCPVGEGTQPFIVAEMSGNHNQSLERALEIVEAAAKSGVNAVKLQTYTADTMTLDLNEREFSINNPESLWHGYSLYDLYKKAHTPWEWHKPIFDRCAELGVVCFSAPFDNTALDFLESLDCPAYKIASFENIDLPLIRSAASKGKPLIISTGMASIAELEEAVQTARTAGCEDIILLKCTSSYPSSPDNTNLKTIPHLREMFDLHVGISDHTLGIGVSLASVSLGAVLIEKHFTLSRDDGGVDSPFSLEPVEMKNLVEESRRAWQSIGTVTYGPSDDEKGSLQFRRSLYIVEDIGKDELLSLKNVRAIRPGLGLPPKYLDVVLGKRTSKNLKKGTPLSWDHI
ncbi:MAG: pseudaminic acid synthase [Nitrospinota bacterium]